MSTGRRAPTKITALVSDVDGTLVTKDKVLTARTRAAVAAVEASGILFTIISARPQRGLKMFVKPLALTKPMACFNGGMIVWPDLSVISDHVLPTEVAQSAVNMLAAQGLDVWVFAGGEWLVRNPNGPYVGHEQHTVEFDPTIVDDFGSALACAGKIVGVSADFNRVAQCERDVGAALAGQASVARSQQYYVDITHPSANKGAGLLALATLVSVPLAEIAVIGDGANDVAMFRESGFSIAMGNASLEVQAEADVVTESNAEDGFAEAIERFILRNDGSAVAGRGVTSL